MKKLIVALALLAGSSVFAAQPSDQTEQLARIFVNQPEIAAQLAKEDTDMLTDFVAVEDPMTKGVTNYTLTFGRSCFCARKTAKVTVFEDLRPTFLDGMPIYSSTVMFTK